MMAGLAPPDTHTLILLQHQPNKPTTRTYLEHPSTSAAILDLISLFETKLRLQQHPQDEDASATLKYTDVDVIHYIDSLPEIACLVRESLPGTPSAYVPKDKEWIKQYVRPVLLEKLAAMRAASSAAANPPVSTLASRMSSQPPAPAAAPAAPQATRRRRGVSPPPARDASPPPAPAAKKQYKKSHDRQSKILVATTTSKPTAGKITKRLGPAGAAAKAKETQLFTAAYAEKKGLAHVAKPLAAPAAVAGSTKRGSASGNGGTGGRRGGGRR